MYSLQHGALQRGYLFSMILLPSLSTSEQKNYFVPTITNNKVELIYKITKLPPCFVLTVSVYNLS